MTVDHTQVNSYQDKLLEAMQIVSSQLISSIPYDKTIICTIINDEEKDKGKYTVINGEATFEAYSSDTKLKKDDIVYVTIPEGNYDNQKIIQGKKTSDIEKPFVFTTPFDTILDLTDNLITDELKQKGQLIANNEYTTIKSMVENENGELIEKEVIKNQQGKYYEICHLTGLKLAGYTRLGLKADFMSWLPNISKGSYGLRITVTDNLNTTTLDDQEIDNVQQTKIMLLDVSDMYGNPYNFETYYSQEKVFPITELNTITDIKIDFYQIAGSFYDIDNEIATLQDATVVAHPEEAPTEWTYSTEFGHNLFVDNIYISLGYDVSEITDELVVPVINDSMTYSAYRKTELNKKEIDLRWVHQFADGPRVVDPESDFGDGENQLKDCEIRWYRYRLGAAAADEYSGVYWTGLTVKKQDDKYVLSDWDGATVEINKTDVDGNEMFDEEGNVIKIIKPDFGEKQPLENVVFIPNTNYQTEQIKAIIFLNGVAIRGPVITFTNEESTIGKELTDFINALEIECVDGTQGNYLLYNEAGNILNYADIQLERKLSCNFAIEGNVAKSNLLLDYEKGDTISWKIPIQNSMISLQRCGETEKTIYKEVVFTEEKPYQSNKYYTNPEGDKYELAVGDQQEGVTYYEQQINSGTIDLNKVWIQVNEYDGPVTDLEVKQHDDDKGNLEYYAYEKNGIEYYKHPSLEGFVNYYEPWNIYKDKNQNFIILQGNRTLCYNEDTKITSILYPTYKINGMYNMYNMNNTIACTIRKDRIIYTTEKEFTFGVSGTMGSDKSLVVDFVGGHTAIIAGDTSTAYQLEVRMYDENNKPVDLSGVPITWSWYAPGEDMIASNLSFIGNSTSVIGLKNNGLDIDDNKQIYIAKVVVGEESAELETYFSIPIKSSEEYSHIEGATSVIYLSNGEPDYYKGDYKLYITNDDTIGSPDVQVKNNVTWGIISQEADTEFVADVNEDGKQGLKPISVYTSGIKNYAVVAKVNNSTVWQQPILVIRNRYPSRVINKWDGKTLVMDKEKGTILSTAIAAGRKDDSNTFTGVMIGDWTETTSDGSLTQATGVFGFHQGEMCYAFTDDGKAFLGKSGEGRIDFNGNTGKIYSQNGAGMEIDLDDGLITSKRLKLEAGFVNQDSTDYLILNTDSKASLNLPTAPTLHGIYPFELGKYLKADFKGQLYAASGKIGAWNFLPTDSEVQGTTASAGSLYSGTGSDWTSIILDPTTNTVTGGKFKASVLEALSGAIKLGGQIQVYPFATKIVDGKTVYDTENIDYRIESAGGTFGFVTSNFGFSNDLATGVEAPGIGIMAKNGGVVKATDKNVGMSIGGTSYLSITSANFVGKAGQAELKLDTNGFAVKTTSSGRLIATNDHSGIGFGSNTYVALYSTKLQLVGTNIDLEYVSGTSEGGATVTSKYMQISSSGTQLNTSLTVSGDSTGNGLIVGSTTTNATTTLNGKLTVSTGGAGIAGGLTVGSDSIGNGLTVGSIGTNATTTLNGKLTVSSGGAGITGNSYFLNHLTVGQSSINEGYKLYVNGTSYISSTLTINSGGLTVNNNGGASISGNGYLSGNLDIGSGRPSSNTSKLYVSGAVYSTGSITSKGAINGTSLTTEYTNSGSTYYGSATVGALTAYGAITFDPTKTQTGIKAQFA